MDGSSFIVFLASAIAIIALFLLAGRAVRLALMLMSTGIGLGLVCLLAEMLGRGLFRGGGGLGLGIGIIFLLIPFTVVFNYALYVIVFEKTTNCLRGWRRVFVVTPFIMFSLHLFSFVFDEIVTEWVWRTLGYYNWIFGVVWIALLMLGLCVMVVSHLSMLIIGLKRNKCKNRRGSLVFAFFLPIVGSLFFLFFCKNKNIEEEQK